MGGSSGPAAAPARGSARRTSAISARGSCSRRARLNAGGRKLSSSAHRGPSADQVSRQVHQAQATTNAADSRGRLPRSIVRAFSIVLRDAMSHRTSAPDACPLLGDCLRRHAGRHPVHRPRLHFEGDALHPAGPALLERAGGLRLRRLHARLRAVRDPRRMAGRQVRSAEGPAARRGLVVLLHGRHGPGRAPRSPWWSCASCSARARPAASRTSPRRSRPGCRATSACARRACSGWRRAGAARRRRCSWWRCSAWCRPGAVPSSCSACSASCGRSSSTAGSATTRTSTRRSTTPRSGC